jgi:hypothetical protein
MTLGKLLRGEVSLRSFILDLTLADMVAIVLYVCGAILMSGLHGYIAVWTEPFLAPGYPEYRQDPRDFYGPHQVVIGGGAIVVAVLLWLSQRMDVWRRRR